MQHHVCAHEMNVGLGACSLVYAGTLPHVILFFFLSPSSLHPEMEKERLFHPAICQRLLPGDKTCPAGDQQVSSRRPGPAMANAVTYMMVAPASCTVCMRLGDRKGLGWGRVKRAVSHLLMFLPDHQYPPLPHISSKGSSGRVWGRLRALCVTQVLTLGEEMVSMQLSWAEIWQLLLALCLLPWPFRNSRR